MPPPLADEPTLAARVKSRFEPWHYLLGLAVIIAGAGAAFADWSRSKATVEQLDTAKADVTAQLGAAQGSNAVQLGELKKQVTALEGRQAKVEGQLELLIGLSLQQLEQSRAIAKATGARQVPTAPPPEPSHPPPGELP